MHACVDGWMEEICSCGAYCFALLCLETDGEKREGKKES